MTCVISEIIPFIWEKVKRSSDKDKFKRLSSLIICVDFHLLYALIYQHFKRESHHKKIEYVELQSFVHL